MTRIYDYRLELNVRFFDRLMMTETTAAASKSSKSKSIGAAFCSLRFGEPDRPSEFFLAIMFYSYRHRC